MAHSLEIRRGVAEYRAELPDRVDVAVSIDRSVLLAILLGHEEIAGKTGVHAYTPIDGLVAAFESGRARIVEGTREDLGRFFSYFDRPSGEPIVITVR